MIRDISIQNFRCFENTSISGFRTVNLITGKNNAGKTALLEALLIGNVPRPEAINALKSHRRESQEFNRALPERTWDSLFFNQDKSKNILIKVNEDNNQSIQISLSINDIPIKFFIESNTSNDIADKYVDFIPNDEPTSSILHVNININDNNLSEYNLIATDQGTVHGVLARTSKFVGQKRISFMPAVFGIFNTQIAVEYDKARLNNQEGKVLKGLQIIDPSIKMIESFNIGSPMLYLQRENEKRLPIALFGDAINRVATIILYVINNNSDILLLDEIENGIHYTNQANLWRMMFRLARELNIQIFATTHSLEMLKAFTEVGLESEFSDLAAHFEMARSVKTGQIIGIRRDMETLEFSLSHGGGVRGE